MQGSVPIKFQELIKLSSLEMNPSTFKFGVCNMESDKYISAKELNANQESILTIVELDNNFKYTRKPNKADAVLMHPLQNIIALKAKTGNGDGCLLQVFNMEKKEKVKHIELNEAVSFWKWVNPKKLVFVTATSAYYLDITKPNEQQVKLLDKEGQLANSGATQIIGFAMDSQEKWCALWGIGSNDGGKTINGYVQLYLIEAKKQQMLEGHCCCFGQVLLHNETHVSDVFCFVERKSGETQARIHMTEISPPPAGFTKFKKQVDIQYAPEYQNDFPIYMQVSRKYGLLHVVTKFGFLYVYEMSTCQLVSKMRISQDTIFCGTRNTKTDGVIAINKSGSVLQINVDPQTLIPYIINQCQHIPDTINTAFKLASRYNLPGCDQMFKDQYNKALSVQNYQGAAQIVAGSPGNLLRNQETINTFKNLQQQQGQPVPILIYFQTLLDKGKLNDFESIELAKPVLAQGRKQFIENWFKDDKLTCSEQLGDLVKPHDIQLAIQIYERGNCQQKLCAAYMETGQTDKAMQYSQQSGVKMDYISMIRSMIPTDAPGAMNLAVKLCSQDPNLNVHNIAELFMQQSRLAELTQFLLECMKGNRPEDANWQTQCLELNLMAAPQVADAILNMEVWNQYNRQKIAQLCEQKGLTQKALENYSDIKDIRRGVLNVHNLNPEWLTQFLGKLQADWCLGCLTDMVKHNRQNLQIVVAVCRDHHQRLGVENCMKIFESVSAFDGLFYFLGAILESSTDKDIHFKYIEAAVKVNQLKEVERVIREKQECYDPVKVKELLKEIKLADPKPLIFLCDIHGYIEELTQYLYKNNFNKYIEIYIFKLNTNAAPQVLGTLIDFECDENYIKQILYNLRGNCPFEPLVLEFEKRNKLRVLDNWLDSRIAEGNQVPAVHNALAKIKIDTNQDPQSFLINNQFYDSKVVGKYCEERDPHLAYTAYKRAWGECDMELIEVTNKNSLYRLQARYLVERQNKDIWAHVLSSDNPHRKAIIEQVVSAALPDSKNVDEVSTTVQAFMNAELPLELLSLLEKIVLHSSEFGSYRKLQHLLLITAIKSDKSRVMDYVKRLDNYDGQAIAQIALGAEYQLYEEAFEIYRRQDHHVEAVEVLINNIENIPRAAEYTEKVNLPEVWSRLGHAYLDKYQVVESIDCYMKANDPSAFSTVINVAENEGENNQLVKYLIMARTTIKNSIIDNALCFAYAKLNKLSELQEMMSGPNSTDAQRVGDQCFEKTLYEAAKSLYESVKNNAKIASCLVRLGQFQKAIESAKKANTPKTWKELCIACVEAQEFKLAAVAGLNIIIHPDHLEDLTKHYEENEQPEQMMELLQQGMTLDTAHIGIFTELGVLYAKYQPEKLMEHCVQYFPKLNVSKLLRVCERYLLWPEAVYLYSHYDEYDNAIMVMIEHSPSAFVHEQFINLIQKVSNHDIYYKAINFYIDEQPMQINGLLKTLTNKLDLSKTVSLIRKQGCLPLIIPFLKQVQTQNNQGVNDCLNELYLDEEDHESLRKSITNYDSFEPLAMAKKTETHQNIEFRRIAAFLYRKVGRFDKSIELSKNDKQYRDVIETAKESGKSELAEEVLRFFCENQLKEFVTVCTYTCYELLKPDLVLELSWRYQLLDNSMPYMIQVMRELSNKLETVQKKHADLEKKEEKQAQQQQNQTLDVAYDMMPQNNMLMAPPEFQQNNMGMGMGMGMQNTQFDNSPMQNGSQFGGFGQNPLGGQNYQGF